MEDPDTPDSQATIRAGLATPIRKTRLYKLTDEQIKPMDTMSPKKHNKVTVNNEMYRSIHGRPVEDHTVRSTFNPPESPNALSPTNHFKSLGQNLSILKPTEPVDTYSGISLQAHNLKELNIGSEPDRPPDLPSSFNTESSSSIDDRTEDETFTPSSRYGGNSVDTSIASTPSKVVPDNTWTADQDLFRLPPQSKTFNQLAQEKGLRAWDSASSDNRWALNTGEMVGDLSSCYTPSMNYPSPGHGTNGMLYPARTSQPEQQWTPITDLGLGDAMDNYTGTHLAQAHRPSSPTESEAGGVSLRPSDLGMSVSRSFNNSQYYVPLPREAIRLESLVNDITAAVLKIDTPHCSRIIKRYFNDRVFGSQDGPEPLTDEEADQVTIYQGRAKTLAELRCDILGAIDDLAEWYNSPAGQGIRERDNCLLHDKSSNTKEHLPGLMAKKTPLVTQDTLSAIDVASMPNGAAQVPYSLGAQRSHVFGGSLASSRTPTPQSIWAQDDMNVFNPVPNPFTYQGLAGHGLPFPTSVANTQNVTYQQTQKHHNYAMIHAGQPRPGTYGPNGIFIPSDRFVRPPASNRLAPLFAQSGAWQANRQATPSLSDLSSVSGQQPQQDNRRLLYIEGSDDMFPKPTIVGASVQYQNLTRVQPPDHALVTHVSSVPFAEGARSTKPAQWGVLKLGNIPYDLSKASVLQFLGMHAKIITPDFGPAIHIIMDRATGKTQECYVEFFSAPDAQVCERSIQGRGSGSSRIADRLIELSISSQDELLADLFPRAKNVVWSEGHPVVQPPQGPYNTGFKSFVSSEELGILVRHAEQPQRCSYIIKCQNRPYEAMISLLAKFPWQAVEHYTIGIRNKIFDAALRMLEVLCRELRRAGAHTLNNSLVGTCQPGMYGQVGNARSGYGCHYRSQNHNNPLNIALLRDLFSAAINTPFSERQRWALWSAVGSDLLANKENYNLSPILQYWPFEVLARTRASDEDVVEWYAKLMASHPQVHTLDTAAPISGPFGHVRELCRVSDESRTVDVVGSEEWNIMGSLIAEMCDPSMWNVASLTSS